MNVLAVFLGGGIGSLARYGINETVRRFLPLAFPLGTLLSNLMSAFLIGWLMGLALNTSKISDTFRLLFVTGFCGGFSTFSAFSLETFQLLKSGNGALAAVNVAVSVAGCLVFLWMGWRVSMAGS